MILSVQWPTVDKKSKIYKMVVFLKKGEFYKKSEQKTVGHCMKNYLHKKIDSDRIICLRVIAAENSKNVVSIKTRLKLNS